MHTIISRNISLFACFVFCLLLSTHAAAILWSAPQPVTEADGIIVKFHNTVSQTSRAHALSSSGLKPVKSFNLVKGLTHARIVPGQSLEDTLSALKSNPNIEYVEPNYWVTIDILPNDPNFSKQYGLHNDGRNGAIADADINGPEAWDLQTGNSIVVAVIDTGVDHLHPDLADNMWENPGEVNGTPGVDDDGNGFIDDINGWDFANNMATPIDDHAHGTHVAGIIAARGNNGIGIAGVNWNARIMALKFIGADGIGSTANAISAINYAVKMGAKISNNSWGGGGFSQALFDTIQAAYAQGHLFVAAAGNDGSNTDNIPHYPSSYDLPNIISVAATDDADRLAGFSNYGRTTVDLAAPGFRIESTIPNGQYQALSGTSMAAPFVAGAAALLLSTNPDMTAEQIIATLKDTADPVAALSTQTVTGGRLNLRNMLDTVAVQLIISPKTLIMAVSDSQQFSVQGGSAPYTWRVDNPAVGQVESQSGLFTALAKGVTQLIVTDVNGVSMRSDNVIVAELQITPEIATVIIGETLDFAISGGSPPYLWSSSDISIGMFIDTATGLLEGIAPGSVQVSVTDSNGISAISGEINVIDISTLSLTPLSPVVVVGDTEVFTVTGGAPPYSWFSSDVAIATIDEQGILTSLSEGVTTVQVTDALGKSGTVNVEVVGDILRIISVVTELGIDESIQITAVGGVPPYQWRVTNSSIAGIDNNGFLIGKATGAIKVIIMDSSMNPLDGVQRSDTILVTENVIFSMNPESALLKLNESINLTLSGGVPPYTLRANDPGILSASSANLTLTGISVGNGFVTITDSAGNSIQSGLFEVREIQVSARSASLAVGDTLQFSATGGVLPYTWTSTEKLVAQISSNGLLTALSAGLSAVTVIDAEGIDGTSETISIGSASTNIHLVKISPNAATLSRRGQSLQFIATGGLAPYSFRLSNTEAGEIDPQTGLFSPNATLMAETTTTVIVVDADGHSVKSGMIAVK